MRPVTFTCEETAPLAPGDIAGRILDVARWPDCAGWRPIPGILAAEFEVRTPGVVGSRIRVTTTDGSSHVEGVVGREPDRRLRLRMTGFSPPLSRLAAEFEECWVFRRIGNATRISRSLSPALSSCTQHPASPGRPSV